MSKAPKKASAVAIGRGRLGAYEGARAKEDTKLKAYQTGAGQATSVSRPSPEGQKRYNEYTAAAKARAAEGSRLVANRKATAAKKKK